MSSMNPVTVIATLKDRQDDERLNLHEVHLILGVSYPTVVRFVKKGYIQSLVLGERRLVTIGELRRFVTEGNFIPPTNPLHSPEECLQPENTLLCIDESGTVTPEMWNAQIKFKPKDVPT